MADLLCVFLSPILAAAAAAFAVATGAGVLRGLRAQRRARAYDRALALLAVRCPACGSLSTWDQARRCGCWSGR